MTVGDHPLDQLSSAEIKIAAECIRQQPDLQASRFNVITLKEPPKAATIDFLANTGPKPDRVAQVTLNNPTNGQVQECEVSLPAGKLLKTTAMPPGLQPLLTPDDCELAEQLVKADAQVAKLVKERYQISDLSFLVCDPWSVHVAGDFPPLQDLKGGMTPRLVQTFLYQRHDDDDNHYAHPLDLLPIVDLNSQKVVQLDKQELPPEVPRDSVNYHRNKLASNSYLHSTWRSQLLAPLNVEQPKGPSYTVSGSLVEWQKWSLRVGFNYREGLVLHDVRYDGRPVMWRGSLVEMAVPYGDPHEPFQRKCAFDVGDYGLGYCTSSLDLGCDCLGQIYYFDAVLSNSKGEPYEVKKAVCMHEEDGGLLWKHVEYRNGHSESRRSRRLVLSFIATVVNYEYLFYWYLMQDGTIDFEIKLSGELSTNLLSAGEEAPQYGTMVAPGVNAQVHQHMFCARLDMAVDGHKNSVCEVNVEPCPPGPKNPYGNAFQVSRTPLRTECEAQRVCAPEKARSWLIQSPGSINSISKQPVAYKLVPHTKGPAQPTLLTGPDSAVTRRGAFATKSLWVTPHSDEERWPAGKMPLQGGGGDGLPAWTKADRGVEDTDVVLWHAFGVVHVPRVEDFPVMPCESTGFSLKPDGFFMGNPGVDIAPSVNEASRCCSMLNGTH